jgi:hypothetical protein
MIEYRDDYPTCRGTHATLRLFSDHMAPEEITALLRLRPSEVVTKGEQYYKDLRRTRHGWFLQSRHHVDSKDARRHIDWLISKLQDRATELLELQSRGVEMDVSCLWLSVGQGGPILEPRQMRELACLNLDLAWEVGFR